MWCHMSALAGVLVWLVIGIVIMLVRHSQGFFDRPPPAIEELERAEPR